MAIKKANRLLKLSLLSLAILTLVSLVGCEPRETNYIELSVVKPSEKENFKDSVAIIKKNMFYIKKDGLCYAVLIVSSDKVSLTNIPCPEE